MDKQELLSEISLLAAQGDVQQEEMLAAFRQAQTPKTIQPPRSRWNLAEILYYIGGLIVLIGVVVLVGQNWEVLNSFTKIMATLGSGIAAFIVGTLFIQSANTTRLGQAFYVLSAILNTVGLVVTFDQAGWQTGTAATQSIMAAILAGAYICARLWLKRKVFTAFGVIFSTGLFYSFMTYLFGRDASFEDGLKFYEYLTLAVGVSYLLLGYYFSRSEERLLTGPLYTFGLLGFLGASLALGGWSPNQNVFWELIFPAIIFCVIYLSIHLKSRAFLILGALYLMGYILKITAEYFTDSLGWPLALVIVGLLLMAIGYLTFYLNKKYLKRIYK